MAALPIALAGCSGQGATATVRQSPVTLTMAFGLSSGQNPQFGARQAVTIIASETLVAFGRDGRAQSRLAESWTLSEDAKTLKITLRSGAVFRRATSHCQHPGIRAQEAVAKPSRCCFRGR
jgi:ABC-type transport system substrate-binding protein